MLLNRSKSFIVSPLGILILILVVMKMIPFDCSFGILIKLKKKDYVNSSWAILQMICTLLEQSYHCCNIACKMKLTDDP